MLFLLLRCLRVFSDGSPVSKEVEPLAFPETRWKNKLFGFGTVGNLQHEVGYLKDLVSRNAEQVDMKIGL